MFFRSRICPMIRYWEGYVAALPPPKSNAEHWEKYRETPWCVVLDPPPLSHHWGLARSERGTGLAKMLKDVPLQGHEPSTEDIKRAIAQGQRKRGEGFGPCPYKLVHPQEKKP